MKKALPATMGLILSFTVLAQTEDPMGLSEYVMFETYSADSNRQDSDSHLSHWRRLTNHEVDIFKATGFISKDGTVSTTDNIKFEPAKDIPKGSNAEKGSKVTKVKDSSGMKYIPQDKPTIRKKELPSHAKIAKQTKTKHREHPESKGTIEVRPTNFPDNPTRDDIVRMQQHIQHIERTVGKALDLSLSAYAVAELPQATEGRSGVSVGFSNSDGNTGVAVGYSSNFGSKHEYTIKINLTHAGHSDAVGAGIGWQW